MNLPLPGKEYNDLVKKIFTLIEKEITDVEDIEQQYPQFVIMYEFFRFLRGEAFTNYREPMGEYQNEIYQMEKKIFTMLEKLKIRIPKNSKKTKYYYEEMISRNLRI